jgi:gag-polypeptide of LTR copia-type
MQDYLSKIKSCYERIRAAGDSISDSSLQAKVLGNLTTAYHHFKTTFYLTTTEANGRSFDDLSRMLISEEYSRKKSGLDTKGEDKVAGFVGTNQKARTLPSHTINWPMVKTSSFTISFNQQSARHGGW